MINLPKKITFGRKVPLFRTSVESMDIQLDGFTIDHRNHNLTSIYAMDNIGLDGVKEIMDKADAYAEEQSEKYDECVKENAPRIKEAYDAYAAAQKKANLYSNLFRVDLAFVILFFVVMGNAGGILGNILAVLFLIALVAFVALVVYANILHGKAKKAYDAYFHTKMDALQALIKIEKDLDNVMDSCYKEIDDIFLASLDSTERQLVLMRREQAASEERERKRDEQMIALQTQNQKLQKEIASQQKELLEIEKERERRYNSR